MNEVDDVFLIDDDAAEPVFEAGHGAERHGDADHRRRIERYFELKRLREQVQDLGYEDCDLDY
ncbi:MAG: hypothetical protein PHF72_13175 [Gammaproteobacteria bacterium]|jgi:hypothetical protein|nr:hypothetical protein [Gammaproteobacteria bacterium]